MNFLQRTVARPIKCSGVGVHSGANVKVRILPADENTGIVFRRTDLKQNNLISALFLNVIDTRMCTVIANEYGVKVSTIEHIMSALWGCNVDNAIVEVDNEEMAIMDGSAEPFVALIQTAGLKVQNKPVKYLKILESLKIEDDEGKSIELHPHDKFAVDYSIDFAHQAIGKQSFFYDESTSSYNREISRARTYGFAKEIEQLKQMGLARGGSLSNAIGIDDNGVMNPEGLRYHDEFARHKLLDCIGDLYLSGYRIQGKVIANKAGHALHNKLLRTLFDQEDFYSILEHPVQISQVAAV